MITKVLYLLHVRWPKLEYYFKGEIKKQQIRVEDISFVFKINRVYSIGKLCRRKWVVFWYISIHYVLKSFILV